MDREEKHALYKKIVKTIYPLIDGETDLIALMATTACELYHHLDYADWVGFYRVTAPQTLKIGPYQGGHGCLTIPFDRGVCGAAARLQQTQLIADVRDVPHHIACSSSTLSEIVVPLINRGKTIAVLDIDSDQLDAFDRLDQQYLEELCSEISQRSDFSI